MFIITILVAVAASAGISYGLHIIGKNDNSMDKVRRYADKRMTEFEEFFKHRVEQLRDAKTEFDTMQDRAAATVKRLDSQLTEFDTKSANLENDSAAVKSIEDKINSYGKILNELIDMTASVEENLD
ncbi:MAG: SpiroCoCo family coiled-coil protein, partial [Treponema sp.]